MVAIIWILLGDLFSNWIGFQLGQVLYTLAYSLQYYQELNISIKGRDVFKQ